VFVGETVPVDIADVPVFTGANEANRDYAVFLSIRRFPLSIHETALVYERPRTNRPTAFFVLSNDPLRELERSYSGGWSARFSRVDRWGEQAEIRDVEKPLGLLDETPFDHLSLLSLPLFEPADNDGVMREIDHCARAVGGEDLTLTDGSVRTWH